MDRSSPARLWPLVGSCALLLLLGVSPWGLWERDEGRYADVAREMLARRDFITPRINGAVFLDKPPLVYWVTAASLALWGSGEAGARFGLTLFAAGILLVTRRIGILLFDRRRANIALIVLASNAMLARRLSNSRMPMRRVTSRIPGQHCVDSPGLLRRILCRQSHPDPGPRPRVLRLAGAALLPQGGACGACGVALVSRHVRGDGGRCSDQGTDRSAPHGHDDRLFSEIEAGMAAST